MLAITKSPTKDKIDKYILALIIVKYVDDITWLRGDTKNEKRNFVSPSSHVMFYLLYKHQ